MALSIATFAALYAAGKAEVQARSAKLRDFQSGSVLDALLGGASVLADQVLRYALHRFNALYLDRAEDEDLDDLIEDRFGLSRHEPQPSSVALDVARDGFVGDVTIPAGTPVVATLVDGTEVEFTTDSNFSKLAADAGPWADSLSVTAVETGKATNLPASGTTWAFGDVTGTSLSTVDDLALTSDEDAAGGRDEETDDAYRSRAKLYYSTLVRGTASALRTGALSVPTVAYATVVEVVGAGDLDTYLYVADASGSSNGTLVDAVEAIIDHWRAVGRPVFVEGAAIEHIALTVTLKVARGANLGGLTDDVRDAVVAYFDATDPGTTVYLSDVEHALHAVSRDIRSADVSYDASPLDRELTPTTAPNSLRVLSGSITVAITEVA